MKRNQTKTCSCGPKLNDVVCDGAAIYLGRYEVNKLVGLFINIYSQ